VENNIKESKWRKFLNRAGLFQFIPFADFVLAAGSLAMGNIRKDSDFDVIIGAKFGRIFTVRFFSAAVFGLFGWRRDKESHGERASDKICLNHFVTPSNYCLRPPYNAYWQKLYENLVPIAGDKEKINAFFIANVWLDKKRGYVNIDRRHIFPDKSLFATFAKRAIVLFNASANAPSLPASCKLIQKAMFLAKTIRIIISGGIFFPRFKSV